MNQCLFLTKQTAGPPGEFAPPGAAPYVKHVPFAPFCTNGQSVESGEMINWTDGAELMLLEVAHCSLMRGTSLLGIFSTRVEWLKVKRVELGVSRWRSYTPCRRLQEVSGRSSALTVEAVWARGRG